MVKGHMEEDGFHPHTKYKKGVRKSRDQKEKTKGVRMQRDFLKEQEEEENKTVAKFQHADRRTGYRSFHLGEFRIITIYPEREQYYECKICGGIEAID